MDPALIDRGRGCAVGAAIGDALGMPLEFFVPPVSEKLVRDMRSGRLAAGCFTDDTEMALAVAESLVIHRPLDGTDLAHRFLTWFEDNPSDVGLQIRSVLTWMSEGQYWRDVTRRTEREMGDRAGNGSVMRCWPVALAWWDTPANLATDSELQSIITHPHGDCKAACIFINLMISHLLQGIDKEEALRLSIEKAPLSPEFENQVRQASSLQRQNLKNSGWVRHTVESAIWGLLTTDTFEEALVNVVNLGGDADTAGTVAGALAGAAYGLAAIPQRWLDKLQGFYPLRTKRIWHAADFIQLADKLMQDNEKNLESKHG